MRVTTEAIQELYEQHDNELMVSFPSLVNGLREHVDRIHSVMDLIWNIKPASILDVGCNRGLFGALSRWSHGPVKRVVGVDISRVSCAYVREHMAYEEAVCLNASEPFQLPELFDLVLCMEIIEHVPNPDQVVKNVKSHLADGGCAIFSCPEEQADLDGEFHVRRVTAQELERLITSNGLHVRQTFFLRSTFCEKPKWQGWNYVIASKQAGE